MRRTGGKARVTGEMSELGEGVAIPVDVSGTGSDLTERQSMCDPEEISCS